MEHATSEPAGGAAATAPPHAAALAPRRASRAARAAVAVFGRLYRIDRALGSKLTPAGWLVLAMAVAGAVFGVDTRPVAVIDLFGLAVGLLAVAALASRRLDAALELRRALPRWAMAGRPFDYRLELRQTGGVDRLGLRVEDLLEPADAGHDRDAVARAFAEFRPIAERRRNRFDRRVGAARWWAYMRHRIGARIDEAAPVAIAAGGTVTLTLRCTPLRRGELVFDAVRVGQVEPLGLMRALRRLECRDRLLVLPRLVPVAMPALPGSRRLQPGGVAQASRTGESEEFVGLRDYRPGDSPRRIHWKAWARTGQPVVREHQDEFFARQALVLDTFGEVADEVFEAAVSLAASLVVAPRTADSLLDLMFVERRAVTLTQGRSVGAASAMLRVLATVRRSPHGAFEALAVSVKQAAPRLNAVLCVLLAWDDARRQLVAALRARGLAVHVWVVHEGDRAGQAPLAPGPLAAEPARLQPVDASRLDESVRPR